MATKTFKIPEALEGLGSHGCCQGCGHGIAARIIYEVIEEMGLTKNCIAFHDLACGSNMLYAQKYHGFSGAHGRAIPTATGFKRTRPDMLVFSYAGDGATYSIGMQHTVHTAMRDENITAIVINNTNFGMTGGQMAPTTLPAEKTASSPKGKDADRYGVLNVVDLIGKLNATYIARGEIYDVASTAKTKAMIKKAFQNQIDNKGFSLVEVLAPCPTNLHMTPVQCKEFVHTEATKFFPLGEFVDK